MNSSPLLVAHRAGNDLAGLGSAIDVGADMIELDVHLRRGRLEVRHLKTAGPLLYDRWELHRRGAPLLLADVLEAAGADTELMLDLKGFDPRMAGAVSRALAARGHDAHLTVCSRDWRTAQRVAGTRVRRVLSAGSRLQLAALRRRIRRIPTDGVSVHRRLLDAAIVAELKASVPLVLSWPVATQGDAEAARRIGIDGLICSSLHLIAERRGAAPARGLGAVA